jgi:site-specific DNA-methyltransferase (adenine-specific)
MSDFLDKDSDEFGTPDALWSQLDGEFHFTFDACATPQNSKTPGYWTKQEDALKQDWSGLRVFCNPPYSRGNVKDFFFKAFQETRKGNCQLVVLLIPAYTERDWFHKYRNEFEVRFIKGRVKFKGGESSARGNHMILIFRSRD